MGNFLEIHDLSKFNQKIQITQTDQQQAMRLKW
jgi:hypothetical protein